MGGHAAVGAVAAVGGVAHFTCNFSIWVGHAAGGSRCAFLGGGTCCAPLSLLYVFHLTFYNSRRKDVQKDVLENVTLMSRFCGFLHLW